MLISLDTLPHSGESANILTASKGHTAGDTTFHQQKDFNSCFFFFLNEEAGGWLCALAELSQQFLFPQERG